MIVALVMLGAVDVPFLNDFQSLERRSCLASRRSSASAADSPRLQASRQLSAVGDGDAKFSRASPAFRLVCSAHIRCRGVSLAAVLEISLAQLADVPRWVANLASVSSNAPCPWRLRAQGEPEDERLPLRAPDLHELPGALLENAARFAHRRVRISGSARDQGADICIEDDGTGLAPSARQVLMDGGGRTKRNPPPGTWHRHRQRTGGSNWRDAEPWGVGPGVDSERLCTGAASRPRERGLAQAPEPALKDF